jgi:hypothetical protein
LAYIESHQISHVGAQSALRLAERREDDLGRELDGIVNALAALVAKREGAAGRPRP